ncbi:MAG: CCA tRNA nucleotidyltransferase, partial [Pseudomonadota bacterium]
QIAAALALPGAEAAYRQGAAAARDAALIQGASQTPPCAPNAQTLADLDDAAVQRFPFTAADLPPGLEGPAIGAALRDAEARWIASGFRATRADLFE